MLFQVILGVDTPKAIGDQLRIKPPSVIEHLHRLNRLGVVELGEKKGKEQHYRVKWSRLTRISLRRAFRTTRSLEGLLSGEALSSRTLGPFLENYFKSRLARAAKSRGHDEAVSFNDLLVDFCFTMIRFMGDRKSVEQYRKNHSNLSPMINFLQVWAERSMMSEESQLAFNDAFENCARLKREGKI